MLSSDYVAEAEKRLQQVNTLEAMRLLKSDMLLWIQRIRGRIRQKYRRESEKEMRKNRNALFNLKEILKIKLKRQLIDDAIDAPDDIMDEAEEESDESAQSDGGVYYRQVLCELAVIMNAMQWNKVKVTVDDGIIQIHCTRITKIKT